MLWGVWRGHEGYLSLSGNRWGGARVYVRGASLDPRGLGREESSGDFDTWPTQCIVANIDNDMVCGREGRSIVHWRSWVSVKRSR